MLADVEGGVMYVQNTNSSVSATSDDSQFSAVERGGVIFINGSSFDLWYSHIFNNSADLGAVISACSSDVNIPHDILYHDPNFPNCLLYDVIENRPSTEPVTTPTRMIPPTGANLDTGIAVAVIACFLVMVLILAAVLVYA